MPSTPVDYLARTREQYDALGYEPYRWAERPDAPPWTPLTKPVADSTVVLGASATSPFNRASIALRTQVLERPVPPVTRTPASVRRLAQRFR